MSSVDSTTPSSENVLPIITRRRHARSTLADRIETTSAMPIENNETGVATPVATGALVIVPTFNVRAPKISIRDRIAASAATLRAAEALRAVEESTQNTAETTSIVQYAPVSDGMDAIDALDLFHGIEAVEYSLVAVNQQFASVVAFVDNGFNRVDDDIDELFDNVDTISATVSANQRTTTSAFSQVNERMDQFLAAEKATERALAEEKTANAVLRQEAEQLKQQTALSITAAINKEKKEAAERAMAEEDARQKALVTTAEVALTKRTLAQTEFNAAPSAATKLALALAILKCNNTQCVAEGCTNVITTSDQVSVLDTGFDYFLKGSKIEFKLRKNCNACCAKKKEKAKAAAAVVPKPKQ